MSEQSQSQSVILLAHKTGMFQQYSSLEDAFKGIRSIMNFNNSGTPHTFSIIENGGSLRPVEITVDIKLG